MKLKKVKNFIIEFNKSPISSQGFFWNDDFAKATMETGQTYIIGYIYNEDLNNCKDGEYVIINYLKDAINIVNDSFSTYPIFIFQEKEKVLISNSIKIINQFSNRPLTLNGDKIYSYFSIGYNIVGETLYKDIKYLKPGSEILIKNELVIKNKQLNRFEKNNKNDLKVKKIFKLFKEALIHKIKIIEHKESVFGLTGGYDSLLGLLFLKELGLELSTVTMGEETCQDIIQARRRSKIISKNNNHIQIFPEHLNINHEDLELISEISGGMTTFGAVYSYKMQKILKENYGYKNFLDCSHFEILRKKINTLELFIERYNTPMSVVRRFIKDINSYQSSIQKNLDILKDEYGSRYIEKFYHYDRNAQGQHWKSLIMNFLFGLRITLIHDNHLLRALLNTDQNHYWDLMSKISKNSELDLKIEKVHLSEAAKDLPFNNFELIYKEKDYFVDLFESDLAKQLSYHINISQIQSCIKNEKLMDLEDWFVLRLGSLLSFCNNNQIIIS
ncbi:MAG: hypothetical protein CMG62_09605 [Candidatus Marinimicrobia bacterium]|nr:hypothetical protein [Candidatus Neomarinimicrobiota bacterium]